MAPVAKKHLRLNAWPDEDRALFLAAFQNGDPFSEESRAAHMSAATQVGLRTAYARFLGFLASEDPDRLRLSPDARVDRESIRAFVKHLRQSCRDTSVASTLHKLRHFLGLIHPERDWSWLKIIAKRIAAQATPKLDHSQAASGGIREVLKCLTFKGLMRKFRERVRTASMPLSAPSVGRTRGFRLSPQQ